MTPLLAAMLLTCVAPPCSAGTNCSCSFPNSRCDEFGVCRCDPGWEGVACERCVLKPGCLHGSCRQPWQCSCHPGWAGRFCSRDLSACLQQPCLNGGTCVMEASGDFSCRCPPGFHGPRCQSRAGPCSRTRSPCLNGGRCEDADGFAPELSCRCLAGFTGKRCEADVDDCLMAPCANGATCLDGARRFSCVCPPGFSGRFCSVNLDDCASRPCLNGGRCLDAAAGFRCVCPPGFTGATCGGRHGDRALKVTVSEQGGGGLTGPQSAALLALTALTLGALALTGALVLQGRCRGRCQGRCRGRCQGAGPASGEPECAVAIMNAAEPQKKKLNT
ncbi:protein delta homolog 2 isoform 1-T2 [Menidia menidia]